MLCLEILAVAFGTGQVLLAQLVLNTRCLEMIRRLTFVCLKAHSICFYNLLKFRTPLALNCTSCFLFQRYATCTRFVDLRRFVFLVVPRRAAKRPGHLETKTTKMFSAGLKPQSTSRPLGHCSPTFTEKKPNNININPKLKYPTGEA